MPVIPTVASGDYLSPTLFGAICDMFLERIYAARIAPVGAGMAAKYASAKLTAPNLQYMFAQMQADLETMCLEFTNLSADHQIGSAYLKPNYTVATWREAAGLNPAGFYRSWHVGPITSYEDVVSHGYGRIQDGDYLTTFVVNEILQGLAALKATPYRRGYPSFTYSHKAPPAASLLLYQVDGDSDGGRFDGRNRALSLAFDNYDLASYATPYDSSTMMRLDMANLWPTYLEEPNQYPLGAAVLGANILRVSSDSKETEPNVWITTYGFGGRYNNIRCTEHISVYHPDALSGQLQTGYRVERVRSNNFTPAEYYDFWNPHVDEADDPTHPEGSVHVNDPINFSGASSVVDVSVGKDYPYNLVAKLMSDGDSTSGGSGDYLWTQYDLGSSQCKALRGYITWDFAWQ